MIFEKITYFELSLIALLTTIGNNQIVSVLLTHLPSSDRSGSAMIVRRVITHNRCDPEECVTAYDMAVGESVPRYTGLYLTHRPEVERGWDPQSMIGW